VPPETVAFHRSLYRADAVEAAAQAYSPLLTCEIVPHPHEIAIRVSPREPASELDPELVDAFGNHVLFESIRRERSEPP